MSAMMDEKVGIDDMPPEQTAWYAAQEVREALKKCQWSGEQAEILSVAAEILAMRANQ